MNDSSSIRKSIREFVIKKFPGARKRAISDELPLLEAGIIDSMGILEVVTYLEQTFHIRMEDEELTPDNFATIDCMTVFVEGKLRKAQLSA